MTQFTADTLPTAVQQLFELNHYRVHGPVQIHGAEVDLVAEPKTDPFGVRIYIEVTIERVTVTKFGKDATKFVMIDKVDPQGQKLVVSSRGFTNAVIERANRAGIATLTYQELFSKFEQFDPYISSYLGDTAAARELRRLSEIYEEPLFSDTHGADQATTFLTEWKNATPDHGQWLLVTGEYGTGKTALTKVLLYRWLAEYQATPQLPLPLRIELRAFTTQFNARGLLHDFLDRNNLAHISVDFVFSLIRSGRAILILDGYDEMAQYLHARERRTCLEALAELSEGGARGIITSRPNYFTETEELQMYEILYKSLEAGSFALGRAANTLLERERRVDHLLEQFINRYERALKDLTPAQTQALIDRVLVDDPEGRQVVLGLLNRLFRPTDTDSELSLAGKPVIVSYLLEVVEGLKAVDAPEAGEALTEWQIYNLIVEQLMLRDFQRSPEIHPDRRRDLLRRLALFLSRREHPTASEDDFRELVAREFSRDIRRRPRENRDDRLEQLFADLRSSATLTRSGAEGDYGWRFSHNSLREFLVADALVSALEQGNVINDTVRISDAMKIFGKSLSAARCQKLADHLSRNWTDTSITRGKGQLLALLWDGIVRLYSKTAKPRQSCLKMICGDPVSMREVALEHIDLSDENDPIGFNGADFSQANLTEVTFSSASLKGALFQNSILDGVRFDCTDLRNADFSNAFVVESDFSGADLRGSHFVEIDHESISILVETGAEPSKRLLVGADALGYLQYSGADTDKLPLVRVLQFHPAFGVVDKILIKLARQTTRQRRGLEQRGVAHQEVRLAKDFLGYLESQRWIATPKSRGDVVRVTEQGRPVFCQV